MKIGILGGGLTALALGAHLKHDFEILERNSECGGLCRTLTDNGFTFDYGGSHIIFSRDKEVLDFLVSLLGENIVKNRRNTKILYKGRFIKYPFENGLSGLPAEENYECLKYFIDAVVQRESGKASAPKNFLEWMHSAFGKGISEKYMIPYNTKIWNFPPDKMGADWVLGRVPNPPVEDIIKSSLGIETEGYTHQLNFYYPLNGGIQSIIRALESRFPKKISRNFCVTKISKNKNKWVVSDGKTGKEYDELISTIPLQELVKCLENVPQNVLSAVNGLKFNSLITVMIGIKSPKINGISWLYLPHDEQGPSNRVSFPSNYSPKASPEGTYSVLAEITCFGENGMWKKDDSEIVQKIVGDMSRLGLIKKEDVVYTNLRRTKYAYVIYDLDYKKNMAIVSEYFQKQGIVLCGRFSEFKYINMDGCIRSAIECAKKIN